MSPLSPDTPGPAGEGAEPQGRLEGSALGGGRYQVLRRVGSGGMGVVYAALDRQTGRQVALKTLHWAEGEDIYKLKREFRALQGIAHPNLVELHELVVEGRSCFFTMELVDGRPFVEHVRRGVDRRSQFDGPAALSPDELDALRGLIRQLSDGLQAIHRAGRLHRDIKPGNLLVTRQGRVVILDFGVAAPIRPSWRDEPRADPVVGTIAYMSPEQGWGQPLGPPCDWYAVGVVLWETLTGRRAFQGSLMQVLQSKDALLLSRPRELVPGLPADLDEAVMGLLHPDPAERMGAAGLARRLGWPAPPPLSPPVERPLVGRELELGILQEAFDGLRPGEACRVLITGPPGAGKTALLERFVGGLARQKVAHCFPTRCLPSEHLPFRALDGLVDGLSRLLLRAPLRWREALLAADSGELVWLFPVLSSVPGVPVAQAPPGDPVEQRRRAIAALRRMVVVLSRWQPLVLWIDDVQWADADSARALAELMAPPEGPCLLLLLSAGDSDSSPALDWLSRPALEAPLRSLVLGPLGEEALAQLARGEAAQAPWAVAAAQGLPGRLLDLLHSGAADPSSLYRERLEELPAAGRRLLELLAAAPGPLSVPLAAQVGEMGEGLRSLLPALTAAGLVHRGAQGGQPNLELGAPELRELLLAELPPEQLRRLRQRLSEAEETTQHGLLLRQGGAVAARAAEAAAAALAFHQAADCWAQAAALEPQAERRRSFQLGQARALVQAGQSGRAAGVYAQVAEELSAQDPSDRGALEALTQSAEQYLRAGMLELGMAQLGRALQSVGLSLPSSPTQALWWIAWNRLRQRADLVGNRLRPESEVPAAALRRLDLLWAASLGLCWVDPLLSMAFQARFAVEARRAGEGGRVARAMATDAAYQISEGGEGNRRRCDRLMSAARSLARALGQPLIEGTVGACESALAFFSGRFAEALRCDAHVEQLVATRCPSMTWERTNSRLFGLWSQLWLGDLAGVRQRLPRLLREARSEGDLLAAACLGTGSLSLVWLAEDRPDQARQMADDGMALWHHDGSFHTQHYFNMLARAQTSLYSGDVEEAWQRVELAWPRIREAQLLRLQVIRMEATFLRGRIALAGLRSGAGPRSLQEDIRSLREEDLPMGPALGALLQAGLRAAQREGSTAAQRGAVRLLEEQGLRLLATCLRVSAGEEGALGQLAEQGVSDPIRFSAMMAPGWGAPGAAPSKV